MAQAPKKTNRILTQNFSENERPEHIGLALEFEEGGGSRAYLRFTVEGENVASNYLGTIFFNEEGKLQMHLNGGVNEKYVDKDKAGKITVKGSSY